ncbi:MAG: hypothetical protein ACYDCI_12960 [Candidatus Limnocylindrales bacterium]
MIGSRKQAASDEPPNTSGRDSDKGGNRAVKPVRRAMTGADMRRYLTEVGERLAARGVTGEVVLAGGAVMVLALQARGGSSDIDAVFTNEAEAIRQAAREVADAHGLPAIWLNDHVRIFVAENAPTAELFEVPG